MHFLLLTVFCFSGSLSATSTADSLSSSFLCNAVNEVSVRMGLTYFFQNTETAICQSPFLGYCPSSITIVAALVILLIAMLLLTFSSSINIFNNVPSVKT
jgi:hypothetical protein